MSSFNFEETPNTQAKVIDTITLTANEYLSFPTFFVEKHKLKSPIKKSSLKLYFDKSQGAIAIAFVADNDSFNYKVNYSEKYGATSKVKSFISNNEIDLPHAVGKYNYEKYSSESLGLPLETGTPIFVIKLKKASKEDLSM